MELDLSADERTLLAGLVDESLRNLKEEIYHTDTPDYKDQLKTREALMMTILRKLNAGASS